MRSSNALLVATAASVVPFTLSFFVACSSNSGTAGDAGSDAPSDGFVKGDHTGSSSGGEGGMSVPPSGKQLVPTMNLLQVDGVTSDGQVIYTDTTNNNVYAVPIAGGTPAMIVANVSANASVGTNGPVALIWANTGSGTVGQLTVWTAAHGPQMLSAKSTVGAALSKDNAHIIFQDNSTATSTSIVVAGVDGTGKSTLVMSAFVGTKCAVAVGFAGADAVASYCPMSPSADAGAEAAGTLNVYSGASWTPTNVSMAMQAGGFAVNPTGDHILYFDNAGLQSYPVAGGAPVTIEANPSGFILTPDGSKVVYATFTPGVDGGAGTLGPYKVSPVGMSSPTVLGMGLEGFYAISPDGNWVLGYDAAPTANNFTDTLLGSASMMLGPQSLNKSKDSSPIGDSFTGDSKYAIFTDSTQLVTTMSGMVTAANLSAVAVGGTGTPVQLATGCTPPSTGMNSTTCVWQNAAGPGSKIIYNPNWTTPTMFGFGTADLTEIDMSQSAPAGKVLVTSADANFYLSADKMTIAYSYSTGTAGMATSMSGLWAMPVP
jgi:hypothetical protein